MSEEIKKGSTVQFENDPAPLRVVQLGRWRVEGKDRGQAALCDGKNGARWYPVSSLRLPEQKKGKGKASE